MGSRTNKGARSHLDNYKLHGFFEASPEAAAGELQVVRKVTALDMETAMGHYSAAWVLASCILTLTAGGFVEAEGTECQRGCHSLTGFCESTGECRYKLN
ncbi:hypothetical protein scyTo_0001667 [Scyliorhinus torazame]|uniref:Uncharacterized protein n=1 Tax=Scyliorhinus torazame TaxID=75743 RepID=A0A401PEZ9_SCYTO|nr:hypothetical protein [Scyliorhinus torazame]